MSKKNHYNIHSQLALPFLESNKRFLNKIFEVLESRFGLKKASNQKFIDLGSGDGRVVINAALKFGIGCFGLEINGNLIKEANANIKTLIKAKSNYRNVLEHIHFDMADMFEKNLNEFDYIYIFSLPTMQNYLKHVFSTIKLGATIISYKYPLNNLNMYINLKYQLEHKIEGQILSAFFYTRI